MTSQQVVETIAMQLAERRQMSRARQAAYQALARAIVSGPAEQATLYALDAHPTSLGRSGVAVAA
jgi:hypothetical protein